MPPTAVKLTADAAPLKAAFVELLEHARNLPLEVGHRLVRALHVSSKLVAFKLSPAAVGTVTLEPADFLLDLLAAARAGDLDRFIPEAESHESAPS